jgi:hypothetical protein
MNTFLTAVSGIAVGACGMRISRGPVVAPRESGSGSANELSSNDLFIAPVLILSAWRRGERRRCVSCEKGYALLAGCGAPYPTARSVGCLRQTELALQITERFSRAHALVGCELQIVAGRAEAVDAEHQAGQA